MVPGKQANENVAMDALRVAAAVLVVLEHVRAVLFRDYDDTAGGPIAAVIYFATSLGNEAVIIFFVLSGYWVGGSVIAAFRRDRFSWVNYAIQRLVRLWVVLLPALVLTAICVAIGLTWFGEAGTYTGDPAYHDLAPTDLRERSSVLDALGNLFFTQRILTDTFGTNSPLWSLTYEFWYYVAFPLLLIVAVGRRPVQRVLAAAALVVVGVFVGRDIVLYFAVWLAGAALAVRPGLVRESVDRLSPSARTVLRMAAVCVLAATLATSESGRVPVAVAVGLITLATVGLLAAFSTDFAERGRTRAAVAPIARYSAVSFTLYVVHAPLLLLGAAIALPDSDDRFLPSVASYGLLLLTVAMLMAAAWVIGQATEAQTDRVRRWVKTKARTGTAVER
ncbi:acyltransferase family protein [Nocardioides plantarum]|uniref:Acyltransferase family protein n=1 Tax=Nocardioides plantarum TaxID=29299 RepID=A0ABV5K915_9ACTN|nr:acyltransferase [Nocardioides plantarum]